MPNHYVFIESRDPFESPDTAFVADTAGVLSRRGHPVTVFLVQNGVLATRAGARGSPLHRLSQFGVTVLADDFSLLERGVDGAEMSAGIRQVPIDALVDLLIQPGTKAVWH